MSGALRLYYQQEGNDVTVSSSVVSLISTIDCPKFDKTRLSAFIASGYGNEIPFVQGVECVDPLKLLVIKDGAAPIWVDRKESAIPRISTLEDAIKHCKALFKEQMEALREAIGDEKVGVELTAGLDSRLISSIIMASGFDFNFISYPLFGPDSEISHLIAKGLNKEIHTLSNIPIRDNAINRYGEFDFGFDYYRQYCNDRWNIVNKFQFSGARGECIDTPDIYSDEDVSMMKHPVIGYLLKRLCLRELMMPKYQKLYHEYLINLYRSRGFNTDEPMSEKEQVRFDQMLTGQFTGDYMYNSGVQAHVYFYQIYNEYHFNHFIMDIAFDAKCRRRLTLSLIKAIGPELAKFPFVSRRRTRKESVNAVTELPLQYKGFSGVKKVLPKFVVNFVYGRLGRRYDVSRLKGVDMSVYKEVVNVKELTNHPNLYSGNLNRLSSVEVLRREFGIQ